MTAADTEVANVIITEEGFQAAIKEAIIRELRGNSEFVSHIRAHVCEEVSIQAPGNPRINAVIKEVQEHLDRYPAIAHDVGLQNAVGKAIFEYLQGKL